MIIRHVVDRSTYRQGIASSGATEAAVQAARYLRQRGHDAEVVVDPPARADVTIWESMFPMEGGNQGRTIYRLHCRPDTLAKSAYGVPMIVAAAKAGWEVAANNYEMCFFVKRLGFPCLYLPTLWSPGELPAWRPAIISDEYHVAHFGRMEPWKLTLEQFVRHADYARTAKKRLVFHVNRSISNNPDVLAVVTNLLEAAAAMRHTRLEWHDWMPWDQLAATLATMNDAATESLSESFGMIAYLWRAIHEPDQVAAENINDVSWDQWTYELGLPGRPRTYPQHADWAQDGTL